MNKGKAIIGCASSGVDSKIGRIFQVIISTPPDYFRKPIPKNPKEAVKFAENAGHFMLIDIFPKEFKGDKHIVIGIMELLNTMPEFWNHTINILYHADRQDFLDNMELTDGLKRVKIDFDKWNIIIEESDQYIPKVCKLAKKVADYYRDKEIKYIKTVYGDYNSEEEFIEKNPNIIHIRKS